MCDQDKLSKLSNEDLSAGETELWHTCTLANAIEKLYLDENTSDVVLIVEEQRFHAHKAILAARSEYFNALFYGKMKESKQTEIKINETPAEPFKLLLEFLYCSKMNLNKLNEEIIMEILELSRQYGIEDLETGICNHLKKIFSVANICIILDKVLTFEFSALKDDCVNFADTHAKKILKNETLLTLSSTTLAKILSRDTFYEDEINIFRAVRKWIEHNKPENADSVLFHVRLPLIEITLLIKEVWPSNLFSEAALLAAIDTQLHAKYEEINYRKFAGVNFATEALGAKVIHGKLPQYLLDGNSTNYNSSTGYTYHPNNDINGITIELGKPYTINSIKMLLWDLDDRLDTYYIDASVDGKEWVCVIDNRDKPCRSWQTLSFPPICARFIKIVGTHDPKIGVFSLVSFECMFTASPEVHCYS